VATGSSYADTVRAVRQNNELNPEELWSPGYRHAQNQRWTFAGRAGSVLAAQKLSSAIVASLGDKVRVVSQLSQYAAVEIVDLDAAATEAEVLSALQAAISGA
jgi:hypothetical protein